jgi:hypothetical protein
MITLQKMHTLDKGQVSSIIARRLMGSAAQADTNPQ